MSTFKYPLESAETFQELVTLGHTPEYKGLTRFPIGAGFTAELVLIATALNVITPSTDPAISRRLPRLDLYGVVIFKDGRHFTTLTNRTPRATTT
jgi:hypothetical protein